MKLSDANFQLTPSDRTMCCKALKNCFLMEPFVSWSFWHFLQLHLKYMSLKISKWTSDPFPNYQWSRDDSFTNQNSQFFRFTNFVYKTSHFLLQGSLNGEQFWMCSVQYWHVLKQGIMFLYLRNKDNRIGKTGQNMGIHTLNRWTCFSLRCNGCWTKAIWFKNVKQQCS
jgi:hypothetical protein